MISIGDRDYVSHNYSRGTDTRQSDFSRDWVREINGKKFDFCIAEWAYGPIRTTIFVWKYNTTTVIHQIEIPR